MRILRLIVLSLVIAGLFVVPAYEQFSLINLSGFNFGPSCDITQDIVANYSAAGTGLADDTPAFNSFNSFAVGTYQPANPGKTICLTSPANKTYFFGTSAVSNATPFNGIKSFVFNANGSGIIPYINLTATATTSSGGNTLTFSSVPSGVSASTIQGIVDLTNSSITISGQVMSTTATTVTITGTVSGGNVAVNDVIQFEGSGFHLGTAGSFSDNLHSALLEAVTAGDTVLKFVNATDVSIFSTGWNFIGGVDQQGFGDPQNLNLWEYVDITALHTGTTGGSGVNPSTATLASPVKFSYKMTWPHYSPGSSSSRDEGGPAALFVEPPSWDASHFYNNLVVWNPGTIGGNVGTLTNAHGRSITFNNCITHAWGINIAETMSMTFNNCNMTDIGSVELDKLATNTTYTGGSIKGTRSFTGSQSDKVTFNNIHVLLQFNGAPGTLVLNNVTDDGALGDAATSNGATELITCTNSVIHGGIAHTGISDSMLGSTVTMSGGLMTIPLTLESPLPWAVPGVNAYLSTGTSIQFGIPFTITDLTADMTNSYVQTSFAGGFPASLVNKNIVLATQSINFSGCTGDPMVVDWSQAGARNASPYTYSHRIYTCTNNVATIQAANPGVPVIDLNNPPANQPVMARTISSITVAVSPADTSAAPTVNWHLFGQFDNYGVTLASGAQSTWGIDINLKTSGTRTYTGSTSAWTGGVTGDILNTTPNPTYMGGSMSPFLDQNISGEAAGTCPVVTATIQSN